MFMFNLHKLYILSHIHNQIYWSCLGGIIEDLVHSISLLSSTQFTHKVLDSPHQRGLVLPDYTMLSLSTLSLLSGMITIIVFLAQNFWC